MEAGQLRISEENMQQIQEAYQQSSHKSTLMLAKNLRSLKQLFGVC